MLKLSVDYAATLLKAKRAAQEAPPKLAAANDPQMVPVAVQPLVQPLVQKLARSIAQQLAPPPATPPATPPAPLATALAEPHNAPESAAARTHANDDADAHVRDYHRMQATLPLATRVQRLRARAAATRATLVSGDYSALQAQRSLLPYLVACSPVMVTSVLAPPWLSVLMAVPCALALYRVTLNLEKTLFDVPSGRAFAAYAFPLNLLMMLWCVALAMAGQMAMIPGTAFAWTALLCLAVGPACRWARERTTRRVPLRWSFGLTAALVITGQAVTALQALGWVKVGL